MTDRADYLRGMTVGLALGLALAALLVAAAHAEAPRSQPEAMGLPTATGVPLGSLRVPGQDQDPAGQTGESPCADHAQVARCGFDSRPSGTPSLPAVPSVGPSPAATARPRPPGRIHGVASWVRASLGDHYLAARLPKGTVLRICGSLACVTRTVNDWGPDVRVFPERIVDLSRADFRRVCGDPILLGLCRVTVSR